jgi:hypothetical protein
MKASSEVKSGLALGLAYFIWLLGEKFLGFHDIRLDYLPFVFWLFVIFPAIGINWAMKAKRDRFYKGKIHLLASLRVGIIISITMSLSAALMKFIYVFLVNPLYYDNRIAHDRQMIEELDIALGDKEKMISKVMNENTLSASMVQTFLFMILSGCIITIVAAVMLKKNTRTPLNEDSIKINTPKNS